MKQQTAGVSPPHLILACSSPNATLCRKTFLFFFLFLAYFLKQEFSKSQTPQQNYSGVSLSVLGGTAWLPLNWCAPLWAKNLPVHYQKWAEHYSLLLQNIIHFYRIWFSRSKEWSHEQSTSKGRLSPAHGLESPAGWTRFQQKLQDLGNPTDSFLPAVTPKATHENLILTVTEVVTII